VKRPNTHPNIYVDSIEDLIETTLQEVPGPLSLVVYTLIEPEDNLEGENLKINIDGLRIMDGLRIRAQLLSKNEKMLPSFISIS
jgi:hypothetical protein